MSSSFRRRQRPPSSSGTTATARSSSAIISGLAGTKPWTGGITLTSVGLRDLDQILGGGQPLGTVILLEQDRWTLDLSLSLTRYWCAEAIAQGQILLIPSTRNDDNDGELISGTSPLTTNDETEYDSSSILPSSSGATLLDIKTLLQSLPRNLHWDKNEVNQANNDAKVNRPLEMVEEKEEEYENEAEEALDIAWQYRKSIQHQRLGHAMSTASRKTTAPTSGGRLGDVFCHSYDLSGRMNDQRTVEEGVIVFNGSSCCEMPCNNPLSRTCGFKLYQCLVAQVKERLAVESKQVVRLLLYNAPIGPTSIALPLLLAHVRTHQLPVVILVTTKSWRSQGGQQRGALISLRRTCDVVLQAEGFASRAHYPPPPEFRHLHGLLLLPKVSTVTAATANGGGGHFADMTVSKRPPAHVYGLKRDRRKLHIPLLHIPPEDYAGGGGSVGGGGVRSGAGRPQKETSQDSAGCGSGGGSSLLDF